MFNRLLTALVYWVTPVIGFIGFYVSYVGYINSIRYLSYRLRATGYVGSLYL